MAKDLRDTRLLHDLSVRLVSESDTQAFFDEILSAALVITNAAAGTIRLVDWETDELELLARRGFEEELVRRFKGPAPWVCDAFASGRRIFVELNEPTAPYPKESVRAHLEGGFRSAQTAPLVTRAGRTIGVLTTYWRERRRPLDCEMRFLDMLARQAVELIERRRTDEALRDSQRQLSAELADTRLLQLLSAQLIEEDGTGLYETLVDAATSIMRSDAATLQMLHPERGAGGELHLLASRGFDEEAEREWEWVSRVAHTACAHCLRLGTRVLVSDFERCEFMAGTDVQAKLLAAGIRAGVATPLVSRAGKTVGMISTFWRRTYQPPERNLRLLDLVARQAADLMERAQALEAVRESERQLKEADRHKDEFLAVLAHELRNPLAPIRTGLELMRIAWDVPHVIEESRAMMERQVVHMVRLIDDLLDVSRIASGKIQLRREHAALGPLVSTAVETTLALLDKTPVSLDIDLPAGSVLLDVDPTRFVQILSNVLHNAFKFSPPQGRVSLTARVCEPSQEGCAGQVELEVRDAGVGISPELMPRLFELFTQEDGPGRRTREGLGIGLALTRRLVDMHGGVIRAESQGPGLGSTFTIRLPLAAASACAPADEPRAPVSVERRVVVVDDNVDAANALCRLIKAIGGECRVAYDGASGLAEVLRFQPDVVLLDIGMHGMDGYEVCRRIRGEMGQAVVVVALTGWGRERDKLEAKRAGFDAHLTKPAQVDALEAILVNGRPVAFAS
jgi:signal transduction histidine kinase/ActR/RegA family two-component response regulator